MSKRIAALAFIFVCTAAAWFVLSGVTTLRTSEQDSSLKSAVGKLWGTPQTQVSPNLFINREVKTPCVIDGKATEQTTRRSEKVNLAGTDINVGLDLDHRRKGLLWYSTYRVKFDGLYTVTNSTAQSADYTFVYPFPSADGLYDDFRVQVDGKEVSDYTPDTGKVTVPLTIGAGESRQIRIAYGSQGMDNWWYQFGAGVTQIRNFRMTMQTDFTDINFPENSISPTQKEPAGDGWKLTWQYDNLVSGIQIGMQLPQKLNPGPFVSRVSMFAPVSLFFFFFLMFIITIVRDIKIHSMNYFFLACAFFAFHLLMAYLADHVDIHVAFAISAAVSIFLVISYMRIVIGNRFAWLEVGISQFVYLVLFAYAFFLEGFTGLAITVCAIVTLFAVMQFTAKIDWGAKFAEKDPAPQRGLVS